jgi:SAM-dependent methyltransferase
MTEQNQPQIDLWNGRVGEKWAALQPSLDAMLAAVTAALRAQVGPVRGLRVLDVGCGAGTTCLGWLADGAEVTGVDVSGPMLAVAASRTAGRARLLEADAADWRDDAPYDLVVSQFGVMFFADPAAAFANLAANLRPGGRLVFACWREPAANDWATVPVGAIRDLLPPAPPADPHAPGPFALADRERLAGVLAQAGLAEVTISSAEVPICLAAEGGLAAAVRFALQIGPAASALAEADNAVRAAAAARIEAALSPFERDGRVELRGATWLVAARRPG